MRKTGFVVVTAMLLLAAPAAAQVTVTDSSRGYMSSNNSGSSFGASANYPVGASGGTGYLTSNYFTFNLPNFTGTVTSATFKLSTGTIIIQQNSPITYTLTSTASTNYADLGTETIYSSGNFTTANADSTYIFTLDQAALNALTSGATFTISGRVTSPIDPYSFTNVLFAGSYGPNYISTLTLNGVTTSPEPAAWTLMILGFGLAGSVLRRTHKSGRPDLQALAA